MRQLTDKTILALMTDAFGGHGGIALYNRDFLTAVCSHPRVSRVVAFPRHAPNPIEALPEKLSFMTNARGGKIRYFVSVLGYLLKRPRIDLIVCGHINLLPLAFLLRVSFKAPILLEIYGIDAWRANRSRFVNFVARKVDAITSISELTKQRFVEWSGYDSNRINVLPNAIHMELYGAAPRSDALLKRYGLEGRTVLMTLGRLVSEERSKGFDEVLEILPKLARQIPNISYLIVGGGSDRSRLEAKARRLGVSDRVAFAGLIPEDEKADHYRLADVYLMPSRGEGFGFVFLEAMACGIPVIGSKSDGSREALRQGELGTLVDPDNPPEIITAVHNALWRPRQIPAGLHYFSFDNFQHKAHQTLEAVFIGNHTSSSHQ